MSSSQNVLTQAVTMNAGSIDEQPTTCWPPASSASSIFSWPTLEPTVHGGYRLRGYLPDAAAHEYLLKCYLSCMGRYIYDVCKLAGNGLALSRQIIVERLPVVKRQIKAALARLESEPKQKLSSKTRYGAENTARRCAKRWVFQQLKVLIAPVASSKAKVDHKKDEAIMLRRMPLVTTSFAIAPYKVADTTHPPHISPFICFLGAVPTSHRLVDWEPVKAIRVDKKLVDLPPRPLRMSLAKRMRVVKQHYKMLQASMQNPFSDKMANTYDPRHHRNAAKEYVSAAREIRRSKRIAAHNEAKATETRVATRGYKKRRATDEMSLLSERPAKRSKFFHEVEDTSRESSPDEQMFSAPASPDPSTPETSREVSPDQLLQPPQPLAQGQTRKRKQDDVLAALQSLNVSELATAQAGDIAITANPGDLARDGPSGYVRSANSRPRKLLRQRATAIAVTDQYEAPNADSSAHGVGGPTGGDTASAQPAKQLAAAAAPAADVAAAAVEEDLPDLEDFDDHMVDNDDGVGDGYQAEGEGGEAEGEEDEESELDFSHIFPTVQEEEAGEGEEEEGGEGEEEAEDDPALILPTAPVAEDTPDLPSSLEKNTPKAPSRRKPKTTNIRPGRRSSGVSKTTNKDGRVKIRFDMPRTTYEDTDSDDEDDYGHDNITTRFADMKCRYPKLTMLSLVRLLRTYNFARRLDEAPVKARRVVGDVHAALRPWEVEKIRFLVE